MLGVLWVKGPGLERPGGRACSASDLRAPLQTSSKAWLRRQSKTWGAAVLVCACAEKGGVHLRHPWVTPAQWCSCVLALGRVASLRAAAVTKLRSAELLRLGFVMALAMTLHNMPEGFAVRAGPFSNCPVLCWLLLSTGRPYPEDMGCARLQYAHRLLACLTVRLAVAQINRDPDRALRCAKVKTLSHMNTETLSAPGTGGVLGVHGFWGGDGARHRGAQHPRGRHRGRPRLCSDGQPLEGHGHRRRVGGRSLSSPPCMGFHCHNVLRSLGRLLRCNGSAYIHHLPMK